MSAGPIAGRYDDVLLSHCGNSCVVLDMYRNAATIIPQTLCKGNFICRIYKASKLKWL